MKTAPSQSRALGEILCVGGKCGNGGRMSVQGQTETRRHLSGASASGATSDLIPHKADSQMPPRQFRHFAPADYWPAGLSSASRRKPTLSPVGGSHDREPRLILPPPGAGRELFDIVRALCRRSEGSEPVPRPPGRSRSAGPRLRARPDRRRRRSASCR